VIKHVSEIDRFEAGRVLVTHRTDPDWEPMYSSLSLIWGISSKVCFNRMKKSSAIVTDQGGRTCHAAMYNLTTLKESSVACYYIS
jgi:pyruvate,water dikinase